MDLTGLRHDFVRAKVALKRPAQVARWRRMRHERDDYGASLRDFDATRSIFVHIPKTAGLSVCQALYGSIAASHATIRDYELAFSGREFDRYFKFCFVRNPWDRAHSAYRFLADGGMDAVDRAWAATHLPEGTDFETFVMARLTPETARAWLHFRPQVDFLRSRIDGRLRVDFIGRFERLAEDFGAVAARVRATARLAHANKSREGGDWRAAYTPAMRDRIAAIYAEDLDAFGYRFD
jgi:hypothetical protein